MQENICVANNVFVSPKQSEMLWSYATYEAPIQSFLTSIANIG